MMERSRGKKERWRVNLINLLLIAHCVTLRGEACFTFAKYVLSSTPLHFFILVTFLVLPSGLTFHCREPLSFTLFSMALRFLDV